MPAVVQACPTFEPLWCEFLNEWQDSSPEDLPYYLVLGDFALHLNECLGRGETSCFPSVFALVESWHVKGEPYVREAAKFGLLEGLQNCAGGDSAAGKARARQFEKFLGPESLRSWCELYRFWGGESTTPKDDGV